MRWTHVWMRDGVLPLNRERLKTTSTVKTRVSQVGQAAYLFSSENLLLPPQANATHIAFNTWWSLIVLCRLITHGTGRSLSGCPRAPCKQGPAKCCCLSSDDLGPQHVSLVQLRLPGAELGTPQGSRKSGGMALPLSTAHRLMPTLKQHQGQRGWGRPAGGMPCSAIQLLPATGRDPHQPALEPVLEPPQLATDRP